MAFIGTPLDTRNTFQSLVGKRFNGDGSETEFTLDVAPSSVLDIEVFVGNVRQDPNSAYTLSGTTLTFTGAPPSGTNNIYVVHQAKSVGTIDPPANSVGVTQLNLSDGSNGQFIQTNGSGTISFGSAATALDDITTGDAASTLATSAGNITIDAQGNDTDIIFKGTDNNSDTTFLTIDGSEGGDLLVGTSPKISSNGAIANFSNHNGSATETALGTSDGNEKVRCFNSGVITFESQGTEGMRLNGNDLTVSRANNFTNNGTGGGSGVRLSDVGGTRGEIGVEKTGTSAAGMIYFYNGNGTVGGIVTDGSNTSYATTSDYRLKENAVAISDGITRLKTLKPYRFNFKADKDKTVDGFFAHEVTAVPEAITGEKDAMAVETRYTSDDVETQGDNPSKNIGDPKTYSTTKIDTQGIDQSKLVPLLTAALKEAITKIESLEARVTTLEG
jgi:hypothetical protein